MRLRLKALGASGMKRIEVCDACDFKTTLSSVSHRSLPCSSKPSSPQHQREASLTLLRRRHVRIFKGGGYVMADMVSMLRASGLSHALSVTRLVHEADCVVAKARWNSGRHVNLEQVGTGRWWRRQESWAEDTKVGTEWGGLYPASHPAL